MIRGLLPKEAIDAQRRHPRAYGSLLVAMLSPMVAGITLLGMVLRRAVPAPSVLEIAVGAGAMIVSVPLLMMGGASLWLVLARRIVPRSVAKAFFVHPGFGVISRVSAAMFLRVYGRDDQDGGASPQGRHGARG